MMMMVKVMMTMMIMVVVVTVVMMMIFCGSARFLAMKISSKNTSKQSLNGC